MATSCSPAVPKFSWWGCAIAVALMLGIIAWQAWQSYQKTQHVDPLYPILAVWCIAFTIYRWRALRRAVALGTLSAEDYRANPSGYFRGSFKEMALWGAILLIALIAVAFYKAWSSAQ